MLAYTIRRAWQSVVTVFIVITVVFLLMRLLPMEGYFGDDFDRLDQVQRDLILDRLGLLDPWYVQLGNFYAGLLRGDLGESIKYRQRIPVIEIVIPKVPVSMRFGLTAVFLSLTLGLTMGVLAARDKNRLIDKSVTGFIVFVSAVPAVVYLLFIQLYATQWFNLPILYNPRNPMSWILPALSMSLSGTAGYAMWIRRFMVDELNKDYIKLARAKGLPNTRIMFHHVLRNAFVPMAQYLPTTLLFTIAGSLFIESLYSIPGMGGLLIDAISLQDNPLVQLLVLIYSSIGVFGLFAGDILMAAIDPRIKLIGKGGSR
ncbi:MAG: ABC transporter permease [Spirochaetaceae bacterium]|nr:MAG: ABC transporter permease [Spirochaetaceae bacterium]